MVLIVGSLNIKRSSEVLFLKCNFDKGNDL